MSEDTKSIPYVPPRPTDPSYEHSDDSESDQLLALSYNPPPYYGSKDAAENLSRSYASIN